MKLKVPNPSEDVLFEILQRLPIKTLFRFKCVCKSWIETIESPLFARLQLDCSYKSKLFSEKILLQMNPRGSSGTPQFYAVKNCFSDDPKSIRTLKVPSIISATKSGSCQQLKVCTCDGLLLLVDESNQSTMLLWNPTTDKFKQIHPPKLHNYSNSVNGFGYDSSTQSFKIVRVVPNSDFSNREILVFTSKTNSWRRITQFHGFPNSYRLVVGQTTALINGVIFFLARFSSRTGHALAAFGYIVFRFCLASERFMYEILQVPRFNAFFHPRCIVGAVFVDLGGFLCLQWICDHEHGGYTYEALLLKEYGNDYSQWYRLFDYSYSKYNAFDVPYHELGKDRILHYNGICLLSYLKNQTMKKKMMTEDRHKYCYYMSSYVESLVDVS